MNVIGLSLSLCLKHWFDEKEDSINVIVDFDWIGHLGIYEPVYRKIPKKEVMIFKIISNTTITDTISRDKVFNQYSETYWVKVPKARGLAELLLLDGRLVQPRIEDPNYGHTVGAGIWITNESLLKYLIYDEFGSAYYCKKQD